MPVYVLTIDVGTTNVKAAVFDEKGRIVKHSRKELTLLTGPGGVVEHDPREVLKAVFDTARQAAKKFDVDAISLSFYQHGLLLVDREGRPLTNILTHMDTRSAGLVRVVETSLDPSELYRRTGCPPLFVYSLPKVLWVKRSTPSIAGKARWFLLGKDYLVLKLLGEPYTDYGNASGSQLFNITSLRWDDEALRIADLGEESLPKPVEGAMVLDRISGERLGLKGRMDLVLGSFDGACQNFGYLSSSSDTAVVNLGTTAVLRVLTRKPVLDMDGLRTFCYYAAAGLWAAGGSTNNGGSVLRWLRDVLGELEKVIAQRTGIDPYSLLVKEASKSPPGARGLIFLPFMAGERFPFRDPHIRGVLLGLGYEHGRPDIIRAFLEGVAFTLRAILDSLVEMGVKPVRTYGAGGGFQSRLWAEIVASVTGLPVYRVRGTEYASNRGAAVLALLALGYAKSLEDLGWSVEVRDLVRPLEEQKSVYENIYASFIDAYRVLSDYFQGHRVNVKEE